MARYEFAAKLVKGKNVLDIACGAGYGSTILSDAGALSVDGVDISKEAIDYANFYYKQENILFVQSDIHNYSSDKKYDVIVCFETIEHVENYRDVLKCLERLMTTGGSLIISSPNRLITSPRCKTISDRPRGFHVQEFTIEELKSELENIGLKVENNVYGQRQQRYFSNRLFKNIYKECFKPKKRFSPEVTLVTNRVPRYFTLIAKK